jgi:hypothetical protein
MATDLGTWRSMHAYLLSSHMWLEVSSFQRFDVSTSRFVRTKRKTQWIFCYVGTAKRGTQTKFLTFQRNFHENVTFRSNEMWNANFFLREINETWNGTTLFRYRFLTGLHVTMWVSCNWVNMKLKIYKKK